MYRWFCLILSMVLLVVAIPTTMVNWNNLYDYKGYSRVVIEDALQIQLYQGDKTSITSYDENSDEVWVTYDFKDSSPSEYGLVGIPNNNFWFRWMALGISIVSAIVFLYCIMSCSKEEIWP